MTGDIWNVGRQKYAGVGFRGFALNLVVGYSFTVIDLSNSKTVVSGVCIGFNS